LLLSESHISRNAAGIPVLDEELIRAFQDGNNRAYDELVGRYRRPLFNFLCRIVNDAATAEDLLQETFVRLWLNRHSYREIAKFSTWIYTIAGNLAKTELRRLRIRRWISLSGNNPEDKPREFPDENSDPQGDLEQKTKRRRINQEIQKLPLVFREVIILRDMQELSYEEISSILKIPLGTVKSRVNRGRQRLKEKLTDLL